jgi:endogenous inhibitor of DNA gyrase (YacG/DUF329 family)
MRIRCPTCHREEDVPDAFQWRPFCSRRCKIIDLGNWLDEVYRVGVPTSEDAQADDGVDASD